MGGEMMEPAGKHDLSAVMKQRASCVITGEN